MKNLEKLEGVSGRQSWRIEGFEPEKLGLSPDDPVMEKFSAISRHFESLRLPLHALPRKKADEILRHELFFHPMEQGSPDFKYGVDYFFGEYKEDAESGKHNARHAVFHDDEGVEEWRIMKSYAFTTPNEPLVMVHYRGDHEVDTVKLAHLLHIDEADLTKADVGKYGLKYGIVSPFAITSVPTRHIFDKDLVDGSDYPDDDIMFTSSGDTKYYVGFDVRRYIMAVSKNYASRATFRVSKPVIDDKSKRPVERVVARRQVTIIGGDSGIDTGHFGQAILEAVTEQLKGKNAYFGDRSLPMLSTISDPAIAGSINTSLYDRTLRNHVAGVAEKMGVSAASEKRTPIVTFSSMAMHGIAGDILRQTPGIEYLGPQEAVQYLLASLGEQGVEIVQTVLLGLPSIYNRRTSAMVGEVLDQALHIDSHVQEQIQEFVKEYKSKQGRVNQAQFYNDIVATILTQDASVNDLKGKNVAVILGASELDSFASHFQRPPDSFTVVNEGTSTAIVDRLKQASAVKVRLVFIRPSQVLATTIAQKTLEP